MCGRKTTPLAPCVLSRKSTERLLPTYSSLRHICESRAYCDANEVPLNPFDDNAAVGCEPGGDVGRTSPAVKRRRRRLCFWSWNHIQLRITRCVVASAYSELLVHLLLAQTLRLTWVHATKRRKANPAPAVKVLSHLCMQRGNYRTDAMQRTFALLSSSDSVRVCRISRTPGRSTLRWLKQRLHAPTRSHADTFIEHVRECMQTV